MEESEDIYLKSYETMGELKEGIKMYFTFYNKERFYQSIERLTPLDNAVYENTP